MSDDDAPTSEPAAPQTRPGGVLKMSMREFVPLVAGLMSLNALAIDIMLPALPALGDELQVSDPNHRQYVVISYVIGLGIAQLFFGPASDRYGRRAPLLVSMLGYSLFGLVCIFAPSFQVLVAARALQGVAAAGARVVSQSVVRDVYAGSRMARVMSLVMMVFMAVPMLAPMLGQAVLYVASWRWTFVVLVVCGQLMTMWVWWRLDETLPIERRRPLVLATLLSGYKQVFTTRVSRGYMIGVGVTFGSLFAFISSSQQLYGDVYDRAETFTLYFASVTGVMAIAAFLNSRLVMRFGMRRMAHSALSVFTLVSLTVVLLFWQGYDGFWVFHGGIMAIFFCFSFIGSNFNAMAMEPLGHIAGTASAALGFASTLIAASLGAVVGQQFDGSALPVMRGFFVLGATALLVVLYTERGRLFGQDDAPASARTQQGPASTRELIPPSTRGY